MFRAAGNADKHNSKPDSSDSSSAEGGKNNDKYFDNGHGFNDTDLSKEDGGGEGSKSSGGRSRKPGWAAREQRRKDGADPLAAIPRHIRQPSRPSPRSSSSSSTSAPDASSARLARESPERARAQALIARKKAERARADSASSAATPSTVHGGYGDMYNRAEVEEARRERTWGRRGREVDLRGRRWDDRRGSG